MVAWVVCPGEETIAAYAEARLAGAERDELESHLDTCSICQELVVALAKLSAPAAAAGDTREPEIAGYLGRYVLLARLGAGGMGVVYAAYDPELDRRVAVKVLRRARAGELLRDEARAIARLAHPNVIAVHDVGEADGEVFVAMEHVEGVTVREWLRTPRSPLEILDVFAQAGRGLAAAHGVGLVHRDVKPSNIILGADGRARVLDFGLARSDRGDGEPEVAGTPAYMAPEQKRGEAVDGRADQYAFCVALAEALGGQAVSDRVSRALKRGRSERAADRYPSMEALLAELAPSPVRVWRWAIAMLIVVAALGVALVLVARDRSVDACARAGEPIAAVWGPSHQSALRAAFGATALPFAPATAASTIDQLDAWATRWRAQADATCRATMIDRVQPVAVHTLRQSCLDQLVVQLRSVVALALTPDAEVIARAGALAASLPSPERCADIAALGALPPLPPAESARADIDAMRAELAVHEAALLAGRARDARPAILALRDRAAKAGYGPLHARAELLVGRLEVAAAHYAEGIAALHTAARTATAARDLETLAAAWIELTQALGNDLRTYDEAELFAGYAEALVAQLPDRDAHALQLAMARCNRNVTAAQAAEIAAQCTAAIAFAERAVPPRRDVANAARIRLGHFQRLQAKPAEALATIRAAITEAVAIHGPQHPNVALGHYALGIALIAQDDFAAGIAALQTSLAIREVAFPGGNVQVAESLIGLGDALGASGKHPDAVAALERGLAMLEAVRQSESAHAVNAHILIGMSLEELQRIDDAVAHYVRAADIADRSLQHRENLVAMGLRSAARLEASRDRIAESVPYLERAVRVLERGKAAPHDLGKTQFALGQALSALPRERDRARAMIAAARASLVLAGAAAELATLDAFVREHGL
jgi:tetratricopeptide (TPR) repeat protein